MPYGIIVYSHEVKFWASDHYNYISAARILFLWELLVYKLFLCGQANCLLTRKFFLHSQTMVLNYFNVKTRCLFFFSNKFLDSHVKYVILNF